MTSSSLLYSTFFHSLSFLFTHFSSFLGSSSARPVRWIVDQVCTEVRRLRERAERSQVYTNTPKKRFVIRIFGAYFVTSRNAEIIYLQSIPEIDPSSEKVICMKFNKCFNRAYGATELSFMKEADISVHLILETDILRRI